MAPFPAEIDVYSIPHARMKELVDSYQKQTLHTDFQDNTSVQKFLANLSCAFTEFKLHEQIENEFILQKLKTRLLENSVNDTRVCTCHDDHKLIDILDMVTQGQVEHNWTIDELIGFSKRLTEALDDFTDTFIPHMKQEEEVFQPLLIKYFKYEELKRIKAQVLQEHEHLKPSPCTTDKNFHNELTSKICKETDALHLDSGDGINHFSILPEEIKLLIFEKLDFRSIANCSRVCRNFHEVVNQSSVWKHLDLRQMSREFGYTTNTTYEEDFLKAHYMWTRDVFSRGWSLDTCHGNRFAFVNIDMDEVFSTMDENIETSSYAKEKALYVSITKSLMPKIGNIVTKLVFSRSPILNKFELRNLLSQCPNVEFLDLSFTRANHYTFKNIELTKLKHLDLTSCLGLSDRAIGNISDAILKPNNGASNVRKDGASICGSCHRRRACSSRLDPAPNNVSTHRAVLQYLSLSGCFRITDQSLLYMAKSGALGNMKQLMLSGCHNLTGNALSAIVKFMPKLDPTLLSYCNQIDDGPYQTEADGCHNLESAEAFCCRTSDECLNEIML